MIILGFDYGRRRIGIAVGQSITGSATPLQTLVCSNNTPDWSTIDSIIQEWQPSRLVVGDPINEDGHATEMSKAAQQFARALQQRFNGPVELQDERLSSHEASAIIRQQRQKGERRKRQHKSDIDELAAALIVERWLQQNR